MGQIRGKNAHIDACNLRSLSSFGTPAAGQHILVSTDNSATADGQGNFDCYVVGDGATAATALEVKKIDGGVAENVKFLNEVIGITEETTDTSIIDYTPKGTSLLSDNNYWANIGSKTLPDRDEEGILKSIVVIDAPSSDTAFSIKLYKKVWTDGQITSFTEIPNSVHSFTMPAGQTSLDVSSSNIRIAGDVVIFISKLAKYNNNGGDGAGYGTYNGNFVGNFAGTFNISVNYIVQFKTLTSNIDERFEEIQGEVDDVEKDLDIREVTLNKSIIDYTPAGADTLVGNNYWAAVKSKSIPDRASAGILKEIVFTSGYSSNTSFSIKLYKKVWNDGQITSFTEVPNSTHSFTMPANQTTLNVLSENIVVDPDVLVFVNGMAKYDMGGTNYGIVNGNYGAGQSGNFNLNVDYIIQVTENTSVRLMEIEAALPSSDVFAGLEKANVVCLGDSITWLGGDDCNGRQTPSQGWTTYFKAMLKPKTMHSYARSGATWSHTANTTYNITENTGNLSDDNVIYNQINRLLADTAQPAPDIIIIAAGTNDGWYASQRPDAVAVSAAEEFADTSGYITSQAVNTLTSIAAAMRYDIEMLKTNYPNAQIFVTTPLQSTKFTLAKGFQIGTIIKECAECLSIECIDQGKQAGIYRAQEIVGYTFTYDGAHTSALGAKMVGQFILKNVVCKYRDKITIA